MHPADPSAITPENAHAYWGMIAQLVPVIALAYFAEVAILDRTTRWVPWYLSTVYLVLGAALSLIFVHSLEENLWPSSDGSPVWASLSFGVLGGVFIALILGPVLILFAKAKRPKADDVAGEDRVAA